MQTKLSTFDAAEGLLHLMLSRAEGGDAPAGPYRDARAGLLADASVRDLLPSFVRTCRDPQAFWTFIKYKYGSYHERRVFLRESFEPLLAHLEQLDGSPVDSAVSEVAGRLDSESVSAAWAKALARRTTDPDGAITAARTLLESVCKTILDDRSIEYGNRDDLPKLYGKVSKSLNLAPSDHTEEQFKAILGACTTVVNNLGTIRNRDSDSHGQGRQSYKPAPRHAALAVNLAGGMAVFLIETHQALQKGGRQIGTWGDEPLLAAG